MKNLIIRLMTALLAFLVGVSSSQVGPGGLVNVQIKIPAGEDDAIEIVFRDLMQRYPAHPVYFLSFAETDPSDEFMTRFKTDRRIKKLSQAIRNANQVIDRDSGVIGVHLQAGSYYPINENEVRVGAAWKMVERLAKNPGWTIWCIEYRLQRVNGKWVIESSKIVPPIS